MLRLTVFELFARLIPEGFVYCLTCYIFSQTKIDKRRFILTSILLGISIYIIRFMPIHFGVHTILFLIVYIILCIAINKIEAMKVISSGLIVIILMYTSEWLNTLFIQKILKVSIDDIVKNAVIKVLYFLPSLFLVLFIVIGVGLVMKRVKGETV